MHLAATKFAVEMGFKEMNLSSPLSIKMWNDWKANNCQPNYRTVSFILQF